jgi:hypothetical protein
MTAPKYETSSGEMPRGDMAPDVGGGVMTRGAAEGSSMPAPTMRADDLANAAPLLEGMPHDPMPKLGTTESQPGGGEMPPGPMEDMSSTYRAVGAAGGLGSDMTAGSASGNDMPRGDMQMVATGGPGSSTGNGDMPRGGMTGVAPTSGTVSTSQVQAAQSTPMAGMEITGLWRLTVTGISTQGGS